MHICITSKLILRLRRRLVLKLKRRLFEVGNLKIDLENQEIHGEVNIQNSHNFFLEVQYVDFLRVTKFVYISFNPLL